MFPRPLGILRRKSVYIPLVLMVAWFAFGWLGVGPLVKWGAEKYIADKTGHALSVKEAAFDPLRLKLTVRGMRLTEPDGKPLAGFSELFVDFEAASLTRWAWTFDTIRLTGPEGRLALLPGGRLNWSAFLDAFKDDEEDEDSGLPRLLIRHFHLNGGRLDLADRTVQPVFETSFNPLDLSLDELSTLPDDKGAYQISARTVLGAQLRWKGDVVLKPVSLTGSFSVEGIRLDRLAPYLKGRVAIAAPEGVAGVRTGYRVGYADKKLSLNLDNLGFDLAGLRLRGVAAQQPALAVDKLSLSGGRFDLDRRRVDVGAVRLDGARVNLARRADGSLDVMDWFQGASTPRAEAPAPAKVAPKSTAKAPATAAPPWQVELARCSVDGVGIHLTDAGFAKPLALDVGNLRLGFRAAAKLGGEAMQATLDGGELRLDKLALTSAGQPAFQLGAISLEGIGANLAERRAEAKRLALDRGSLALVRGRDGRIALLDSLVPVKSAARAGTTPPAKADQPAWRWRLERAEANDFRVDLRDQSVRPAVAVALADIDASATGLSQDMAAPVPVRLSLRVRPGGALAVDGKLVPAKAALDARVRLAGLDLRPAQPYLAEVANVVLVSGLAGSQGRLRVGKTVSYRGGFSVDNLRLNEAASGERLLAWKRLASSDLAASPKAVEIGEIKVDGLGLKLIIHEDKTVNLKRLLKQQAPTTTPAPAPAPMPTRGKAKAAPEFRFGIDRVSILANEMEFADESLALPFGTRIHGLKGSINGISLAKGQPAQLELDGLVDDYGLARAVGQIDLLDPTGYMDIKVVFRNVEMNRLTPYSATFAGRRIASGKLSLDLDYKIKARQLQGDNQIVMDKLTLGERVESPTAKNLPLDLAIAILQDSNGVIDLGLPVSGSLDDPQFSYGAIIWKAIVNVIGKIVTAPFRALGKLLGISGEQLERILFDPGEAALTPPERDKLKQLAEALAKRPGLALTVTPGWLPEGDREAIKETRVRRALAEAMGRKLAPDEDPGPVSIAQAKTQEGLEKLYAARFGAPALETLKGKFVQANPEPPPASTAGKLLARLAGMMKAKPEPLSEAESARLKGANLHELIYQAVLDAETVTDAQLVALADARAASIRQFLLGAGVPAERMAVKAAEQIAGDGRNAVSKLGLGVAPKPAAAAP